MLNTKRNILLSLSAFAFTLALTSTSAFSSEDLFKKLDTNTDGMISKAEAEAHQVLNELFDSLDLDGDGFISPSEFTTANLDK
ncbi:MULTISPECIES: EF-hand domain-containing protein [Alteromonadaceae]|mgnify:CR=1 FL=1|jgi:Ca2+-binding EF-hand superfamily protein|uniref:EF-hand domain-containing protein n=1 Tax=Brumicola blandensis TaxID=3075611 RepID=A0AAW8QY92_9ALTE|nr:MULTISPECIES: EF-hand domain-containing protein [unclassified Alteromonas]MDT0580913.1 EF-hand domain-containing protein [Alteromonas sp. W409]MDT0629658.1 EF-hand domain-containing protein [Alteromonas sp. W364]